MKICYVDYGNYEESPVTHLRSLPDKYLFYPFQVSQPCPLTVGHACIPPQTIKCCITNDDEIEFSREVCIHDCCILIIA